jgi:4-diphosphocytidyl-2-C-methyl-D-erythritol kinase
MLADVPITSRTQQMAMHLSEWTRFAVNDFEPAVFERHPELRSLKAKLKRLGAKLSMMSGSGSTLFGIFDTAEELQRAAASFGKVPVVPTSFLVNAI